MSRKTKILIICDRYVLIEDTWLREDDLLIDEQGNEYTIEKYKVKEVQVRCTVTHIYNTKKRLILKLNKEVKNSKILIMKGNING